MHKTPRNNLEHIRATRPFCERYFYLKDHSCQGRSTTEHTLYHAGKQIPDEFACVQLCAWAHDVDEFQGGGNMVKEIGEWIALSRATPEDYKKYPRNSWATRLSYLNKKYGVINC